MAFEGLGLALMSGLGVVGVSVTGALLCGGSVIMPSGSLETRPRSALQAQNTLTIRHKTATMIIAFLMLHLRYRIIVPRKSEDMQLKNEDLRVILKFMEDLKKNEIFTAEICGYGSDGAGVARILGRAVFVPGTIIGEIWRVRIVKVSAAAVYGRAEEAVSLSPERIAPECCAYPRCGGCTLRHMSYEEEKRFKLRRLNDALTHIGKQSVTAQEIIAAENICRYRNKGIYTFKEGVSGMECGFYAKRSHALVPVEGCLIQNETADAVASSLLRFARENRIPAYDEESGRGVLRHVFVRTAVNGSDAVACVVAAKGLGVRTQSMVQRLKNDCPNLSGIVLCVNKKPGNVVIDGELYTLWGSEIVHDSLGGIEYEVSVRSFYQINPPQAERLYEKALEYAEIDGGTVLDMYCGAGTISLYLAKKAQKVIGAEIVPEAVENARRNAQRNGIENAEFICADASDAAKMMASRGIRPEAIVTDPPRKGMDESAIRTLSGMGAERIVYVSCNPATLSRDILRFNDCGYELKKVTAVDMFPRTSHVEAVAVMRKGEAK